MNKVAVIGTGNIGSRVLKRLAEGGVDLLVAASSLRSAQDFVTENAVAATPAEIDDAIAAADAIVFAIRFNDLQDLLKEKADALRGKIVIDPSNNIAPKPDGGLRDLNEDGTSAADKNVKLLPGDVKYVKAFGTLAAPELDERYAADGDRAALLYATDDEDAGTFVRRLIRRGGWDAVHVGGVAEAGRIEVFGDLHTSGDKLHGVPSAKQIYTELGQSVTITTAEQLIDAVSGGTPHIIIDGTIKGISSLELQPGQMVRGGTLMFMGKGVCLSADNTLDGVTVLTRDIEAAIYNSHTVADAGTLRLENVVATGQVLITAQEALRAVYVDIGGLHVHQAADVRGRVD